MSEESDESREFEPTEHKIAEARKRGDLVRSTDIATALVYGGILLAAVGFGASGLMGAGTVLMSFMAQPDRMAHDTFTQGATMLGGAVAAALKPLLPWFAIPGVLVLVGLFAQRALVFAPDKLQFKLSRINPIANAKQKFGLSGIFEFLKGFVKMVLIGIILGIFLKTRLPDMLMTQRMGAEPAIAMMLRLLVDFLVMVAMIAGAMGAVDYLWQRADFLRRNRMSRKELTDEMKQSEGDPHVKSQRRQKAVEIATSHAVADTARASVVIVNPTHYAVALKWERGARRAPVCLAKGVDEVAARIREIARENNIPIHADPPTARAIYATVDIGDEIQPQHYRAVASAIRFAEKLRRQARPGRTR